MVRSRKEIEMLINLINISYSAMKLLPYVDDKFASYRNKSIQDFRFALSEGIRRQVFFATFVQKIETQIKSTSVINALKQAFSQNISHLYSCKVVYILYRSIKSLLINTKKHCNFNNYNRFLSLFYPH